MRSVHVLITVAAAGIALAGCTATPPSSAKNFKGAEKDVAQVVDDLQKAGRTGKPDKLCNDIFTADLANRFKAGNATCVDEVEKAMRDVNDYDIKVTDITVTGNSATAKVEQGKEKRTGTLGFQRIGSGWRVSSIS
jgi:hypothetical protein